MVKKSIIASIILVLIGFLIGFIKNWNLAFIFNATIGIVAFFATTAYVKWFGNMASYGKVGKVQNTNEKLKNSMFAAVSYTHLTLPTICSV